MESLTLRLPGELTEALLTSVPAGFHAGVNDVLLTGLALAVHQYRLRRGTGADSALLLDLEGHGREEVGPGLDLSRTVGWFTSLHPVRLDPGELTEYQLSAPGQAFGNALKRIKEQLRELPDHGLGYGMLRHLCPGPRPPSPGGRRRNWASTTSAASPRPRRPTRKRELGRPDRPSPGRWRPGSAGRRRSTRASGPATRWRSTRSPRTCRPGRS
ncbi:hypothetical protein GXW82_09420 [Streptacidiphilus sp. 4-A2]|nr:hypothetical protein [Streptacidiphilus sp. 4-A2]